MYKSSEIYIMETGDGVDLYFREELQVEVSCTKCAKIIKGLNQFSDNTQSFDHLIRRFEEATDKLKELRDSKNKW